MQVRPMLNTDKIIPCTNCGQPGNIIREGADPRLRCTNCGFSYNKSDSDAAVEAGAIPNEAPTLDDPNPEATDPFASTGEGAEAESSPSLPTGPPDIVHSTSKFPRTPGYIFISKDRERFEIVGKRDFRKAALWWAQGEKYDLFELLPKKSSVKIDVE